MTKKKEPAVAPTGEAAKAVAGDGAAVEVQTLAPATEPDASGALVEPEILEGIDTAHPAVDDSPRKGLPATSNQIDFNDPNKPGSEVVAEALGYKTDEA